MTTMTVAPVAAPAATLKLEGFSKIRQAWGPAAPHVYDDVAFYMRRGYDVNEAIDSSWGRLNVRVAA